MADRIAQAVLAKHGPVIIDAEWTRYHGRNTTLMDGLDDTYRLGFHDEPITAWLFKNAFKKAGFKNAKDSDDAELQALFEKVEHVGFLPKI